MTNDTFLVKIPIIRKDFENTSSAKFKGILKFISNKHGIIYDWNIIFDQVWVDLYTTPSWFTKRPSQFKRREELFNLLNLNQEPRPSKTSNKIVKLNDNQLLILNDYFNNRETYDSTIKNIVGIIKGNNPGGEAAKPSSAEMIIDNNDFHIKNFVILIDDLVVKKNDYFLPMQIGAKEIKLTDFIKINESLKSAFDFMQMKKTEKDFATYLNSIKKYCKNYNDVYVREAERIASKARTRFGNEIDKVISKFPFNFKSKDQFQKCHIQEYWDLRNKIIVALKDGRPTIKYENAIKDPNNFIPLPEEVHRKFDQYYFTYHENGKIYALGIKGSEYVKKNISDIFREIPSWFLNEDRKKYIKYRNIAIYENKK